MVLHLPLNQLPNNRRVLCYFICIHIIWVFVCCRYTVYCFICRHSIQFCLTLSICQTLLLLYERAQSFRVPHIQLTTHCALLCINKVRWETSERKHVRFAGFLIDFATKSLSPFLHKIYQFEYNARATDLGTQCRWTTNSQNSFSPNVQPFHSYYFYL